MIRAKMQGKEREIVFLGLSFENLNRLREGQPIMVRGKELGLDVDITIHADKDEKTILDSLRAAGMNLPEPITGEPLCPDDGTPLLITESLHTGKQEAHCKECGRKFGVLQ